MDDPLTRFLTADHDDPATILWLQDQTEVLCIWLARVVDERDAARGALDAVGAVCVKYGHCYEPDNAPKAPPHDHELAGVMESGLRAFAERDQLRSQSLRDACREGAFRDQLEPMVDGGSDMSTAMLIADVCYRLRESEEAAVPRGKCEASDPPNCGVYNAVCEPCEAAALKGEA